MISQADDFLAETRVLDAVLAPLKPEHFDEPTGFKGWTFDDILGHLHFWNRAVLLVLDDEPAGLALLGAVVDALQKGSPLRVVEDGQLPGAARRGHELREAWLTMAGEVARAYGEADPARRVKWVGPEMGVRSAITARQMETWAHGQAVFDLLGRDRDEHDRLRNIAELGVRTFGWTFANRGQPVPAPAPLVRLAAPSGTWWVWNEESWNEIAGADRVEGSAVDFCRVVTQVRNVADTTLTVVGDAATRWMAQAQCFAGPPVPPPSPGTRSRSTRRIGS